MKAKFVILATALLLYTSLLQAQEIKQLSLKNAVALGLKNSDQSKIADGNIKVAEGQLNVAKNLQYPDAKFSGQFMMLANANIDLQTNNSNTSSGNSMPNVNQLMLGQASINVPVFAGFKLKNLIKASKNNVLAANEIAKNDHEKLMFQIISDYINLYKASQTVLLIQENLKSAQQLVLDFSGREKNGLLAKNDLLKTQLQASSFEIALENAKNNRDLLNYKLVVLLKLPENTILKTTASSFKFPTKTITNSTINRGDLNALNYQKKAATNQIDIAKSNYYPSLSLSAGYIALDAKNALTITNAMNIGVGLSYNLSSIFKNKSDIKLAESKAALLDYKINAISNNIKIQIKNAQQAYQLAIKKLQVYTRSTMQAEENYRIVKDKFDNGLMDTNDLLEADVAQLQANINQTYAQADISEKYYQLMAAKGQLKNTFN